MVQAMTVCRYNAGVEWSAKLRRCMDEHQCSPSWVADQLGVSHTTVARWLSGEVGREPSWSQGQRLAELFQVDAGWLFDDAAEWPPRPSGQSQMSAVVDAVNARRTEAERGHLMLDLVLAFGTESARASVLAYLRVQAASASRNLGSGTPGDQASPASTDSSNTSNRMAGAG